MTINYQLDVSTGGNPFAFLRLLSRWKGSIWKGVSSELAVWLIAFYTIHFSYRFLFSEEIKVIFDKIAYHIDDRMKYIPLTFILGFFVSTISSRWNSALSAMPFIDNLALYLSLFIPGKDHVEILYRRNIIRYVVLHQILVFRDISMQVRRRFPSLEYVIDAGFMSEEERVTLEEVKCKPGDKYWVPIAWAKHLLANAFKDGVLKDTGSMTQVMTCIKEFRNAMDTLLKFDQIPIPIAYPQVVFLAVRVYFVLCLVSRQFLQSSLKSKSQMEWPIPFMTCLELIFILGWMKVAEVLLNPLGEDDDDFEINWIIDKNIAIGMAIVDDTHNYNPPLFMDGFSDPNFRPIYSEDSAPVARGMMGSAATVELAKPNEKVKTVQIDHDVVSVPNSDIGSVLRMRMNFSRNPSTRSVQTPRIIRKKVEKDDVVLDTVTEDVVDHV
ncbi:unnamed protein product [Caenorhabditis angaria]|uniref:Bestrophin homolog n=1 Tax=Caenorhabditis angaria TaxID=860376 RepID=A0A9P1MZ76_9PELO|nr:unnamed protein product [Caenorhabditis angaria]